MSAADDRERVQRARARLGRANRDRLAMARLKGELRDGRVSLVDVLERRPPLLAKTPLWELLRLVPGLGIERCAEINRRAIQVGVNLALPLERASSATERWLAEILEHRSTLSGARSTRSISSAGADDLHVERLAEAIAEHRRAVRGPGPVNDFGTADDRLYERCKTIMDAGRNRLDTSRAA